MPTNDYIEQIIFTET
jgi:hypothetical protein